MSGDPLVESKAYLTVTEASQLLNISTRSLYRLIQNDQLHAINFSSRLTRIRRSDLDNI